MRHQARQPAPRPRHTALWIALGLFAATLAVYSQVPSFDFVNFDDPETVSANPHVQAGLTASNLAWAFRSTEAANWLPLTRLTHLLDAQLFGLKAGWHHLTNVLLHALAVVLLFAFLQRATQALWPSAWVAAIFALHPLHVEAVAWISERKDVLSAVFAAVALWSYARYAERPSMKRYLAVCLMLALGLLAKPMLVTLPFVFLLLDRWPLERGLRIREKIPLFALAAVSAIITYFVQQASGAVRTFESFPLGLRIENALVSCVVYLWQTIWPAGMAVFYPYPRAIPLWQPAAAAVLLAAISFLTLGSLRTRPYLAVGWFWYLAMLAPVIGVVQVGAQAHADRYLYLPMIGLTIMVAWSVADLVRSAPRLRTAAIALGAASFAACAVITWNQESYWQDSDALFRHALDVTEDNYLAHHNLGVALAADPLRLNEAISQYRAALAIRPDYARVHSDLGSALAQMPGRLPEAIAEFRAALAVDPTLAIPLHNLALAQYQYGLALAKDGRAAEAIPQFEAALRTLPESAEIHNNVGVVLAQQVGRQNEAIAQFEAALRIEANYADAQVNLGLALAGIPERRKEAIGHLEAADRLQPDPEIERTVERLKGQK